MDALRFLDAQHDAILELFHRFEQARGRDARGRAFRKLADALALHTTIEEQRFYPALFVGPLQDTLRDSVEEHLSAKRLLADLLALPVGDGQFDAKVRVLRQLTAHHMLEEEITLFPRVRAHFTGGELRVLGEELEALTRQLEGHDPRLAVRGETGAAAPLG
jgi:hypothetical protein